MESFPAWAAAAGAAAVVVAALVIVASTIRSEIESRYRRLEAWNAIYAVVRPRVPLPPGGPWMASPELLRIVVQTVYERRPRVVLELGSGLSTVLSAYALRDLGEGGRVVSLEHEEPFCEATRRLLALHGLEDVARVVHAPLRETRTAVGPVRWYSLDALAELDLGPIDLLVIDGPPGEDQRLARFPALPELAKRLADDAVVILDDARRPDEREAVRRWTEMLPGFDAEYRATEKGTAILRRSGDGGALELVEQR